MCWFSLLPRNCREIAEKTEEVAYEQIEPERNRVCYPVLEGN